MKEIKTFELHTAVALLTYGIKLLGVKNDEEGKIYYIFEDSINAQNILTLYNKQFGFLANELANYKRDMKERVQEDKDKFGGARRAFRDSRKRIIGASVKGSNGTHKSFGGRVVS